MTPQCSPETSPKHWLQNFVYSNLNRTRTKGQLHLLKFAHFAAFTSDVILQIFEKAWVLQDLIRMEHILNDGSHLQQASVAKD